MSHVLAAVAWPYANGPRHIGHVSGFGVPSDVFSRYMRIAGHDVLMVSGTDEHGTPITVQAYADGVSPRDLADRYNRVIVEDLHGLGLAYDLFTRTTTRNHYAVTQELFAGLYRNGYIVAKTTLGPRGIVYAVGEEWSARVADETPIERGSSVRVVGQDGLTLIVEPAGR